MDPFRARIYRLIFGLAAAYNIAFGLWTTLFPHSFFRLFSLELPRYPSIWSCLGMIVGLYGAVYAYSAMRLDRAKPLIAIGLIGKLLGPMGWLLAVRSGELPARTFTLITFNDLLWWVPFILFLLEGSRAGERVRSSAPFICGGLNALGGLALLVLLKPGTEIQPDPAARAMYISQNSALWRLGWLIWYASAMSLLGFYAWWAARLQSPRWGIAAWCVAAVGISCDLMAESLFIGWLPDNLEAIQKTGTLLTGGAANGLYTLAGITLTISRPALPGFLHILAWLVWMFGLGLTGATLAGSTTGMMITTAGLMTLFCPWTWLMGMKLK